MFKSHKYNDERVHKVFIRGLQLLEVLQSVDIEHWTLNPAYPAELRRSRQEEDTAPSLLSSDKSTLHLDHLSLQTR